jgi:hypothetical protein
MKIDPVEVFCRIRPLSDAENNDKCLKVIDDNNLMLQIPEVIILLINHYINYIINYNYLSAQQRFDLVQLNN